MSPYALTVWEVVGRKINGKYIETVDDLVEYGFPRAEVIAEFARFMAGSEEEYNLRHMAEKSKPEIPVIEPKSETDKKE